MAMQMRQNLNMRMEQKLKLTPQMIQSIEILLLPQMALEERIMAEIEENPVLEIIDGPDPEVQPVEEADGYSDGDRTVLSDGEKFDYERQNHIDGDDGYSDFLKSRSEARHFDEDGPDKMAAIAATAGPPPNLADHLIEQLRFMDATHELRNAIEVVANALDRRGYLVDALDELFQPDDMSVAEQAWELIRSCDPAGIGAKDLADCLVLQLEREPGDNSFEIRLVEEYLDDLLRNRLPVIATALGVDVESVQEGLEIIKRLDPQPGLPYASGGNQYVIPDVVVERNEANEWVVSVPDSRLPKVEINDAYYQLADSGAGDNRERNYLKEKIAGARFIIDAVAQRKRTLLKIATEIIKYQQAFLEQGVEHLRPLMRQDIADKIGMHVATVSRAVKDKYIQTPAGIIPLSQFFSGGIATQDGSEAESSRSVKLKIKKMIEEEDKKKPLSDQAIADILAKEGLDISRRTVTKYRIADGIPSTRQRRNFG